MEEKERDGPGQGVAASPAGDGEITSIISTIYFPQAQAKLIDTSVRAPSHDAFNVRLALIVIIFNSFVDNSQLKQLRHERGRGSRRAGQAVYRIFVAASNNKKMSVGSCAKERQRPRGISPLSHFASFLFLPPL